MTIANVVVLKTWCGQVMTVSTYINEYTEKQTNKKHAKIFVYIVYTVYNVCNFH